MSQRLALTSLLAFLLTLCISTASRAQGPNHNQLSEHIFNHSKVDDDFNQEQDLVRYIAVGSLVLFGGFFIWPHK
ncbi:MAG TPA: hypothetical protein V6C69_14420 [Trichormus sp.]|jgi:hypothetical protein